MFPTTIWTVIREAGVQDAEALDRFARAYQTPVLRYVRGRGFDAEEAEDICQDVFVRLLRGRVLEKADAQRGRFRSLLLSVARHTVQDRLRKRRETVTEEIEQVERDPDFDREWVLELSEKAMRRMREEGSPYYDVLRAHLGGEKQDRQKLWFARKKLLAGIRHEVALTCASPEELQEELAYLTSFLQRPENS